MSHIWDIRNLCRLGTTPTLMSHIWEIKKLCGIFITFGRALYHLVLKMSSFGYKKPKHKSTAWMADRLIAVAKSDARLQGKWLPASVFFEAVEADEYRDGSDQSTIKGLPLVYKE